MTGELSSLGFSDLYLGEKVAYLSGVPDALDPFPVPLKYLDELNELREIFSQASHDKSEFAIKYKGIGYRVSVLQSIEEKVYVLRKFPASVPDLYSLGIHPELLAKLMAPGISGLIIIAGAYSNGKTTTASALIKERLSLYGGVGITIEDPPEMPLQGVHGEGVCWQTQVEQGEFAAETRSAARWAPSIIFLGEIRDSETATEVLRASTNGRLVVCTTHADNVVTAIERIYSLAVGSSGGSNDVASMMANGLYAVVHQKLSGNPKRPKIEFLFFDGENSGAKSMIRNRKFEMLGSEIGQQLNRLIRAGMPA